VYAAIIWVLEAAICPEKMTWVFHVQSGEKREILIFFSWIFGKKEVEYFPLVERLYMENPCDFLGGILAVLVPI
jgi:hypothetical protein